MFAVISKAHIASKAAFALKTITRNASKLRRVGIIGAPFSKAQLTEGTNLAPQLFRKHGLLQHIESIGCNLTDFGDLTLDFKKGKNEKGETIEIKHAKCVTKAIEKLSQTVTDCIKSDAIALTIGGDNLLSLGTIRGHQRCHEKICVLWIDAHTDLKTLECSEDSNLNEMSVSLLINEINQKYNIGAKDLQTLSKISPCIDASSIVYIGLRAVSPFEAKLLEDFNIPYFSMRDIDKLGIFEVTSRAFDKVNPHLNKSIHISFDIDSIDRFFAPSTSNPIPGGLTLREALSIGEQVANTKLLRALDVMEVNPLVGTETDINNTIDVSINLILAFLGKGRKYYFT
ncbi:Arginase-2-like protein [Dinothrombium tinctorium]|uniref:Arginase n=1 Tax=Dinothrombium tinctorium TaxID=1965070 RepID=A0A443R9N0_9ACAR|nr:Arginase-2-like protein [Dinothrombium tinctorium]